MLPRKAAECEFCGKPMGFIKGMRGFGLREAGHARRCAARIAYKASMAEGSMVSDLSTTVCSSPNRNLGFDASDHSTEEEASPLEACGSLPPASPIQAEDAEASKENAEIVTEQVVLAPLLGQDAAAEVPVEAAVTEVSAEVPARLPADGTVEKVMMEAAVQKVTAEDSVTGQARAATGLFAALCCHRRRATVEFQASGK